MDVGGQRQSQRQLEAETEAETWDATYSRITESQDDNANRHGNTALRHRDEDSSDRYISTKGMN